MAVGFPLSCVCFSWGLPKGMLTLILKIQSVAQMGPCLSLTVMGITVRSAWSALMKSGIRMRAE